MIWNWQRSDWRNFSFKAEGLKQYEDDFLQLTGEALGVLKHLDSAERNELRIELLRDEALLTSQIEGETLDRDSIQSSVRRHFGLQTQSRNAKLKEQGISDLLYEVYENFDAELSAELLKSWHAKLFATQRTDAGEFRTHAEPMQVVSGTIYAPKVHFEAPPSSQVAEEIDSLAAWYNLAHQNKTTPPLTIAAITHLWFECIHPFEDGNGRIGRALAEKSLSQSLGRPCLISLSTVIESKRNAYYDALEISNKKNEITKWLEYFLPTILEAQQHSIDMIEFVVKKGKFLQQHTPEMNERQTKVVLRMLTEGLKGFTGGLSASNYVAISQTSQPTATRDLKDLVSKEILTKTGTLKHTRYWLNI